MRWIRRQDGPGGMSHRVRGIAATLALAVVAPGPAAGQEADPAPAAPKVGCFQGHPLPDCKSFWIIEMQGSVPLFQTERLFYYAGNTPTRNDVFDSALEWNVGHMVNLGENFALGGVLTAGTGNTDPLTGIRVRARRWFTQDVSVEVEAGILRSNATDTQFPGVNGGTADIRLNIRDQGAFFVRWDVLPLPEEVYPAHSSYYQPARTYHGASVGVALGSLPALAGTGTLGVVFAVLLGMYAAESR